MESDVITLQDLFVAKAPDEDSAATATRSSRLLRRSPARGLKPHFLEKMAANGVAAAAARSSVPKRPGGRPTFSAAPYGGMQ